MPDNMMAARNGAASVEFRRVMASETDLDPADWPCQNKKSVIVKPRASLQIMRTIIVT